MPRNPQPSNPFGPATWSHFLSRSAWPHSGAESLSVRSWTQTHCKHRQHRQSIKMPVEALRTKPCDLITEKCANSRNLYKKPNPNHPAKCFLAKRLLQCIATFLFLVFIFCLLLLFPMFSVVVALTCVLMWPLRAHKISTFLWWFYPSSTFPWLPFSLFFCCCFFSVSFDWFWYGKWTTNNMEHEIGGRFGFEQERAVGLVHKMRLGYR